MEKSAEVAPIGPHLNLRRRRASPGEVALRKRVNGGFLNDSSTRVFGTHLAQE